MGAYGHSRAIEPSPAYRRRKATVVLLTLTLILLGCVQGMIVVFAAKDRTRVAQIRELTRRIAEGSPPPSAPAAPIPQADDESMRIHSSAPAREPAAPREVPLRERMRQALAPASGSEVPVLGTAREGLGHLVELANYMAKEHRAALVEWRGRLAILYQKIDPVAADPFWEILNVLSDMKLLDGVTVVAAEGETEKAGELRKALLEFGIAPDHLKMGKKSEDGEIFSGVMLLTHADP